MLRSVRGGPDLALPLLCTTLAELLALLQRRSCSDREPGTFYRNRMAVEKAPSRHERWGREQYERLTHPGLASIIERNIGAISQTRRRADCSRTWHQHVADWMTRFAGSMAFVYLHVVWFAVWVVVNSTVVTFDPAFGTLTMIVSLEAIFLSAFILVSQKRQGELSDRQAQLDLQITLLAEHEITRVLQLVAAVAEKAGIRENGGEIEELTNDVEPVEVLERIEEDEQREGEEAPRAAPS